MDAPHPEVLSDTLVENASAALLSALRDSSILMA
jgi:hypothetical protein